MSEISIAIIGCGTVAETLHLPALMKIKKKVKIEALVDVDED
ncbi:TPA: gfo/Idh/MocA family oxidoreductase, partial [Candidatus Bathyarchaeota archaeon]|nr:gfo/Idh/MocA family oxidoreductase [Candidatus Bathyarchaeota archaeon]